ncbi:MAG TPA: Type 1 glutamine amidotransferase-like domain-containing protein [Polyangiaceae bacterium]|jgi:hypothetical protein
MTAPGSVYLAASSHPAPLRAMATRILAAFHQKRPLRVAATYAAVPGGHGPRGGAFVEGLFGGAKVTRFTVAGEKDAMPAAQARAIVEEADVVFVGGGDPVRGARLLVSAGADAWLRAARARGAHSLGISAGAMMLCAWWADWPDEPPPGAPHDGGELVSGVRVVPDLVVDCHAEDDGWSELYLVRGLLRDRLGDAAPMPRLFGLPTAGGVVVGPAGALEHIGAAPYELA